MCCSFVISKLMRSLTFFEFVYFVFLDVFNLLLGVFFNFNSFPFMLGMDVINIFFLAYPHSLQLGIKFCDGGLVFYFSLGILFQVFDFLFPLFPFLNFLQFGPFIIFDDYFEFLLPVFLLAFHLLLKFILLAGQLFLHADELIFLLFYFCFNFECFFDLPQSIRTQSSVAVQISFSRLHFFFSLHYLHITYRIVVLANEIYLLSGMWGHFELFTHILFFHLSQFCCPFFFLSWFVGLCVLFRRLTSDFDSFSSGHVGAKFEKKQEGNMKME